VPRKNQQWTLIAVLGPKITDVTAGKFSTVEIKRLQSFNHQRLAPGILRGY
jgi:hypothetical protein